MYSKYKFEKPKRIVLLLFIATANILSAQNPFVFQNTVIENGTKRHFLLPIVHKNDTVNMPVTVFHGSNSGPVLGITAGVHGYEYPPILAAQELNKKINPKRLTGTIILVQIANVPSFLERRPYLNPLDNKNLNRSFPGDVNGSITERMAYMITTEVISKSDFFIDIHGGDAPEDLMSYNAWYHSDALPEVSQKGLDMALAMGFDYTIRFSIAEERFKSPSIYCSQEAFHRNIPSIDIECGKLGIAGETEIERITEAMLSLFNHLDMLDYDQESKPSKSYIITKRYSVKSASTGIFYSSKSAGDTVKENEVLGYITDFFGNNLETIRASKNGIILYKLGTPPVNKNETLFSIGIQN